MYIINRITPHVYYTFLVFFDYLYGKIVVHSYVTFIRVYVCIYGNGNLFYTAEYHPSSRRTYRVGCNQRSAVGIIHVRVYIYIHTPYTPHFDVD